MRRVGQGESGGNETGKEVILRVKKKVSHYRVRLFVRPWRLKNGNEAKTRAARN